ncbi:MAG: hypothetical protein U0269_33945 [Polyangiales bacterium]
MNARRASLSLVWLALTGCPRREAPSATNAAPIVASAPDVASPSALANPAATPAQPVSIGPATLPAAGATGCLGWSPETQSVACIEGEWGLGASDRSWAMVIHSGARESSINLAPGPNFPAPTAVTDDPLPARLRAVAEARLAQGGFVSLASVAHAVTPGATETIGAVRVRYTRAQSRPAGENSAPQFNERVEILTESGSPIEVFEEENTPTTDPGPIVTAYVVAGGPVVIHRSAEVSDEGLNVIRAQTWVCDTAARACR